MSEAFVLSETPEWRELRERLDSIDRAIDKDLVPRIVHLETNAHVHRAGNPLTQFRDRSKELADLQEALEAAMADLMEAQKFQAQAEDSANHWRAEAKRLGQERSSVLEELSDKLEEMERWREVALLAGELGPAAREEAAQRIEQVCEPLNPGRPPNP